MQQIKSRGQVFYSLIPSVAKTFENFLCWVYSLWPSETIGIHQRAIWYWVPKLLHVFCVMTLEIILIKLLPELPKFQLVWNLIFQCMGRIFFVWKGNLWNSTQNILPIQKDVYVVLRSNFESSYIEELNSLRPSDAYMHQETNHHYTPRTTKLLGGYTGFTPSVRLSVRLSVRPFVPHAVSALYHLQLWMDSFHVRHKWSLPCEGVSRTMTFDLDLYLQGHSALT